MNKEEILRLLKGVFIGGLSAVGALFAGIYSFALLGQESVQYLNLIISLVAFIFFCFLSLSATGFWGRWGMVLFFTVSPVILIIDYEINPFFPIGVILFALLCYALRSNQKNA
ncbi:hypothetical protein [Alteromonas oceanisediminis]|uniref:hypothetical protein n=1 Tax=Alteromonas oceanisediminis TaxID=2836180 RepID=UPI001BD9FB96|nr:hypothetical protein [Alteromonas oceanisediminis]MBT0588189.1 hypothetical protein [Alteromonas oceanisediminis]